MKESMPTPDRPFWKLERINPIVWVWVTLVAALLAYGGLLWVEARQNRLSSHLSAEQTLLRQARVDLTKGYMHISLGGRPGSPFDRSQGLALIGQAGSALEKALRLQKEIEGPSTGSKADAILPEQLSAFTRAVNQFRDRVTNQSEDPEFSTIRMTELQIIFFALERQAEHVSGMIQQALSGMIRRHYRYQVTITGGAGMLMAVICLSAFAGDRARRQTEQREQEAEMTISRQESTLRGILDATLESILQLSTDGIILMANKTVAKRIGAPLEEIIGHHFSKFMTPEQAQRRQIPFQTVLKSRTSVVYEDERNGIFLEHTFYPVLNKENHVDSIVVLGKDITQRKRAETELYNSHQEKVSLLKEVHHRVKNNLQIVASLLGLQSARTGSPEVVHSLEDARNRIKSMAMLHEKLYGSENLALINFATYLTDLCRQLLASSGPIADRVGLDLRIAPVGLPLESALPCGLIVNELVSNSLKHGFAGDRRGMIRIGLELLAEQTLLLKVTDNGAGLPPGFDPSSGATLGMHLVTGLTAQMDGRLSFETPEDGGVSIGVVFPLPKDTQNGGKS